ncbi:MAG: hypothetical protein EHM80_13295 [Nitrospiraceae bacterium]|nr:MAG: hypothetical protein EHM80_13295 [Nitrospiraceae bacterium]
MALYCGLQAPFSVHYIQSFDEKGALSKRGIRGNFSLQVYSSKGVAELADPGGGESLGSTIFQRAASDPAVMEALGLWGESEVGWSRIYDIIEFVGGQNEIARAGWATKKRTREIRQTANHYRHLGSPKKHPLPGTVPSIDEARTFAADLLKNWMFSRSR